MRTSTVLAAIAAAAVALGALVAVVALTGTDESAGREDGVTLNDVVGDPARYERQRVTISGEWEETGHFEPANADEVIVLGDDAGETLLVVPELGVEVPEMDEDTAVAVTGEVTLPGQGDRGFVAPDGMLDGASPVIAAERVSLVAEPEEPAALNADQVTVRQLLRDPRAYTDDPLLVPGTAHRVGDRGFVLADDGATIFVSAPSAQLEDLRAGDPVRVRAELSRLSAYGADALEKALASDPPWDQQREALDLEDVPIQVGEPYLLLRGLDSDVAEPGS
jgi:hypothetical protein